MFCFLLRGAASLCLNVSKCPFLPWQGVDGTSTDVLFSATVYVDDGSVPISHILTSWFCQRPSLLQLIALTPCVAKTSARISRRAKQLRDAIAAGAAPLLGSAQIIADGTSCAEPPIWLMKPVFRSPSVQDIRWSSSRAFVLIYISMVTDLSSCAESLSSSSLWMPQWARAPPQASFLMAWALAFQLDLQRVPNRILSLRLSFCDIYIYIYIYIYIENIDVLFRCVNSPVALYLDLLKCKEPFWIDLFCSFPSTS